MAIQNKINMMDSKKNSMLKKLKTNIKSEMLNKSSLNLTVKRPTF